MIILNNILSVLINSRAFTQLKIYFGNLAVLLGLGFPTYLNQGKPLHFARAQLEIS